MSYRNPWDHGWRAVLLWSVVGVVLVAIFAGAIMLKACIYGGKLCPM